jgi:BarA-like signal transduction histidine kinase
MVKENYEMMCINIPLSYKTVIREVADKNGLTMTDVVMLLLRDGLENIGERGVMKLVKA